MDSICLMCRKAGKQSNSHFCGQACKDAAEKKGPMILEVPQGHVTFKSGMSHLRRLGTTLDLTCMLHASI
jgi:hypothetical protein